MDRSEYALRIKKREEKKRFAKKIRDFKHKENKRCDFCGKKSYYHGVTIFEEVADFCRECFDKYGDFEEAFCLIREEWNEKFKKGDKRSDWFRNKTSGIKKNSQTI